MIPLWLPDNNTLDSSVFRICPGQVALLVATGFKRYKVRTDPAAFQSPHLACFHRVIVDYETKLVGSLEPRTTCDYLYEITQTLTHEIDTVLWSNGCLMSIGGCNNIKLFAIPGSYYLRLNDVTSLGEAQVWIDLYKADELPLDLLQGLMP